MRQNWHHLLFLHWPVPASQLQPLLPRGLDLDLYDGQAYVGLTPFTMTGVRPVGLPPLPFVSHFHETNLRTYVHTGGHDPGVWFFSLDAASFVAVAGARGLFGLPYHYATIAMEITQHSDTDAPVIDYSLSRHRSGSAPVSCKVRYTPQGMVKLAEPGSLEFYLVERYVLYTVMAGVLYRGRIHHAPWPLQHAQVSGLDESVLAAAQIVRPEEAPFCHYGREVRVEVFGLERIATAGSKVI